MAEVASGHIQCGCVGGFVIVILEQGGVIA